MQIKFGDGAEDALNNSLRGYVGYIVRINDQDYRLEHVGKRELSVRHYFEETDTFGENLNFIDVDDIEGDFFVY